MKYCTYSNYGQILRVITAPTDDIPLIDGEIEIVPVDDTVISDLTHYININTTSVVPFPPKPSPYYKWSWVTHSWVVNISDVRVGKLEELKNKRNDTITSGFTWNENKFDSTTESQNNLLGLYMSAINNPELFPMNWRLANNTWVSLSAADAIEVWVALQTFKQNIFNNYATHEAAINVLTTVEEIQSYDINIGW